MPRMSYRPEIIDEFLKRIASGRSLRSVCEDADMPCSTSATDWLAQYPDFAARYARACEARADAIFEEMLEIADTPIMGEEIKLEPGAVDEATGEASEPTIVEVKRGDMLGHRRLQIETRKWALAKMAPKKYGDRLAMEVTQDITETPKAELYARMKRAADVLGMELPPQDELGLAPDA